MRVTWRQLAVATAVVLGGTCALGAVSSPGGRIHSPPTPPSSSYAVAATVPDVVGETANVAVSDLREVGVTDVRLASVDSRYAVIIVPANWRVVRQSVPPGTRVPLLIPVRLDCVKES